MRLCNYGRKIARWLWSMPASVDAFRPSSSSVDLHMPALYLAQMNPEGRALYLKLPHPRHLFLLQLIPPVSTSLRSMGLEHTLLRLPDLLAHKRFTARTPSPPTTRAAVTNTPRL